MQGAGFLGFAIFRIGGQELRMTGSWPVPVVEGASRRGCLWALAEQELNKCEGRCWHELANDP